jgi:hypothetical protein
VVSEFDSKKFDNFSKFSRGFFGFSDGAIPDDDNVNSWIGQYPNSYGIPTDHNYYGCYLAGENHQLELPEGAIQPRWERNISNVHGCGLVLDPDNKLSIFFTLNGQLEGELAMEILRINNQKIIMSCSCIF